MTPSRRRAALVALATLPLLGACGEEQASPGTQPPATTTSTVVPVPSAARAFVEFAVRGDTDVPWADTVTYSVSAERVAGIEGDRAGRSGSWDSCPESTVRDGIGCPVSPLDTLGRLATQGARPIHETAPPDTVGCNVYRSPRTDPDTTTTWLRPPVDRRNCFQDFAVAVTVDRSGRITGIDLALSSP